MPSPRTFLSLGTWAAPWLMPRVPPPTQMTSDRPEASGSAEGFVLLASVQVLQWWVETFNPAAPCPEGFALGGGSNPTYRHRRSDPSEASPYGRSGQSPGPQSLRAHEDLVDPRLAQSTVPGGRRYRDEVPRSSA